LSQRGNLANRANELFRIGDPLFEEIAAAGRTLLQQSVGIDRRVALAEQDNTNLWMGVAQPRAICKPSQSALAHANVGDHHIRARSTSTAATNERRSPQCRHHFDCGILWRLEQTPNTLAHKEVVLGEDHAD
jgi:hypothetical protein